MKVLFIHHSTGGLLLREGNVRKLLSQKASDIELWDHAYNLANPVIMSQLFGNFTFQTGLSDNSGKRLWKDYNIVLSNNSPKEYAEIFGRNPTDFTLKEILSYDTIVFKNCFPTTKLDSTERLAEVRNYYSSIIASLSNYPEKLFIILTPPPLRFETTKPEWALRARELANWLKIQTNYQNIKVFDFFDLLAETEGEYKNTLKRKYCRLLPMDSHPNVLANKDIGEKFVDFIITNSSKSI